MCGNISLVFIPEWRLELRRMLHLQRNYRQNDNSKKTFEESIIILRVTCCSDEKIVQVQIFAYTIFVICHAIAGFCFDCFYVLSFVSMCGNVALAFAI